MAASFVVQQEEVAAALPILPPGRKFTDAEIEDFVDVAKRDGFVVLKQLLPVEKIRKLRDAYRPILQARVARGSPDRGNGRFYATPPFVPPFFDPEVFQQPDILAVVQRLVGTDCVMCQYAGDTPIDSSSEYQAVHRDAGPLFPEIDTDGVPAPEPPMTQLAVNFGLCDVLPPTEERLSNGPVEIARGTHRLSVAQGEALIASGNLKLEPNWLAVGDVAIRDVRTLHRGTPNRTDEPREMMVIGYSRAWLRRPEVGIRIKKSLYDSLDDEGRALLRYESVVPDEEFGEWPGEGWSPTYDAAALAKASGDSFRKSNL